LQFFGLTVTARLRAIANETLGIIADGYYVHADAGLVTIDAPLAAAVAGTRLFLPYDPLPVSDQAATAAEFEVADETTLSAARRLGPGTGALVFASARNPGGGFLSGAQAQEEDIVRSSALYPCLRAVPEFYDFHNQQKDLRYSDRVILSPSVPVFRDDRGGLLASPYPVTFLTAAAPNFGALIRNQPHQLDSVPQVLRRRAQRILAVAAAHGVRQLVLGAWGCGVFRNNPEEVAEAFALALGVVDRFDRVVFAVYDRAPGNPSYRAFVKVFGR
jgi:uncharacterized protein (TIGR02452 family)